MVRDGGMGVVVEGLRCALCVPTPPPAQNAQTAPWSVIGNERYDVHRASSVCVCLCRVLRRCFTNEPDGLLGLELESMHTMYLLQVLWTSLLMWQQLEVAPHVVQEP